MIGHRIYWKYFSTVNNPHTTLLRRSGCHRKLCPTTKYHYWQSATSYNQIWMWTLLSPQYENVAVICSKMEVRFFTKIDAMPFRGCPRFSGTTKHQCRVVNSRHLKGDGNGWSSVSANHFAIVHNDIRSCILQTGGNKATGVIWACCTIRWFPPPHTYLGKAEHL